MEILGNIMVINIFMAVFICLLLVTAAYLWLHRKTLSLGTGGNHEGVLKKTALALLVVSLIGICILIWGDKLLNVVTLVLACFVIMNLGLRLGRK